MSYLANGAWNGVQTAASGVQNVASWGYNNTAGHILGRTDQNIGQDTRVISTQSPKRPLSVSQPTETYEQQAIREKMYSVKRELINFFQNILMKDVKIKECPVLNCNIKTDDFYFDSEQMKHGFKIFTPYSTVTLGEWMSIYDHICGAHYTGDPQNRTRYKCNDTQNYINANMYTNVYGETKYLFRMISAIVNRRNQYGNITREQWGQFFSQVTQLSVANIMDFIIFFKENISLILDERGGGKKSNKRKHKSRRMSKKNRKTKRRSH